MDSAAIQHLSDFFIQDPNHKSHWPCKPNISSTYVTDNDYCDQARWIILGVYKSLELFRGSGFGNTCFKGQMISYSIQI